MDSIVKKYIEDNIKLIEDNDWNSFYANIPYRYDIAYNLTGKVSSVLLEADINPLEYMEDIPTYYLRDSTVNNLNIPYNIKTIGYASFYMCKNIKGKLVIPGHIIKIGVDAFAYCTGLTDVVLQEGVKILEKEVFWGCDNLINVWLPSTIESLGEYIFKWCNKLETITYNGTIEQWNNINISTLQDLKVKVVCKDGEAWL